MPAVISRGSTTAGRAGRLEGPASDKLGGAGVSARGPQGGVQVGSQLKVQCLAVHT